MSKIQLISCFVNLAGDRNNVVHRGAGEPVTFPEVLVLRTIHGGEEHVHDLVDVGHVTRDPGEERARLVSIYGAVVDQLFPNVGGRAAIPLGDESIPTAADVASARDAADGVMQARKAAKTGKAAKAAKAADADAATTATVPDLDNLPGN